MYFQDVSHTSISEHSFGTSLKYLGLFLLVALVLRGPTFFVPVLDHDESTYIVIADALLQGKVYLKDVVDVKPIGIFVLFGTFFTLFGKSILTIRVVTTLWIALTAWMIALVHQKLLDPPLNEKSFQGPMASGMIYVVMTSVFTFFGLSPNTEIFLSLFAITALLILLQRKSYFWVALAGLLLGLAFMIKFVAAMDALAIGLFYIWWSLRKGQTWSWWLSRGIVLVAGFTIPLGWTWWYYAQHDMIDTFYFFTFELSGRYIVESSWISNLRFILDFFVRFLPISLWFFYCSWRREVTGPALPLLAWIWGGLAMVIILLPGKLFYHYFIQLFTPVSLLAGSFFDARRLVPRGLAWMRKPAIGYPLIAVALIANLYGQKISILDKKDYVQESADWLNERLRPGETIYTTNFHQILYFMTRTECPTPYVHSSLIWDPKNNTALKIDRDTEVRRILDRHPRFIIYRKKKFSGLDTLLPMIRDTYQQVAVFNDDIFIMERR